MVLIWGILLCVMLFAIVLSPFLWESSTPLEAGSPLKKPDEIRKFKTQLINRYLNDEAAFQRGELSAREWNQRKEFLLNRYLDLVRRLDFLTRSSS